MRKLIAVLAAVLFAVLCVPSLAQEADLTPLVGQWAWVFSVSSDHGFYTPGPENAVTITITAEGLLTSDDEYLTGTLEPTETAGVWQLDGQYFQLDAFGQLCTWNITDGSLYMSTFHSPDWAFALDYPYAPGRSTAGTWQLSCMIYLNDPEAADEAPFFLPLDPATMDKPFPVITLPAFASEEEISLALSEAIKSIDGSSAYKSVFTLCRSCSIGDLGRDAMAVEYRLLNENASLAFLLTRTEIPDVSTSLGWYLSSLSDSGPWRLDEMTLGELTLPASALADSMTFGIDALGITRLTGVDRAASLVMLEDEIYLRLGDDDPESPTLPPITTAGDLAALEADSGAYLRLVDPGYDSIDLVSLNDTISLRFISDDAYRLQQLTGEWRVDQIDVTLLDLQNVAAPESLDIRLIIAEPDHATLISGDSEERFTIELNHDGSYRLLGDENVCRLIPTFEEYGHSIDCTALTFVSGDGSYRLDFLPAD